MTNENSENLSSAMSGNKSAIGRFFTSPVALIRFSAILFVSLTIGHMSGYPWTSAENPRETQLANSMKSVDLVFLGERTSYWNLYFGWGLWVAVLLLALAGILWFLADIACTAPRNAGAVTGILSATCLIGAYLSFCYFFIPPFVMLALMFIILLTATVQLLKKT